MYIRLRYRLCHLLQNCHILLHIPRRTCHPVALEPYDQSIGAELTQARELEGRGRGDKKYILIFTLAYQRSTGHRTIWPIPLCWYSEMHIVINKLLKVQFQFCVLSSSWKLVRVFEQNFNYSPAQLLAILARITHKQVCENPSNTGELLKICSYDVQVHNIHVWTIAASVWLIDSKDHKEWRVQIHVIIHLTATADEALHLQALH
jgi:hypothetical protein